MNRDPLGEDASLNLYYLIRNNVITLKVIFIMLNVLHVKRDICQKRLRLKNGLILTMLGAVLVYSKGIIVSRSGIPHFKSHSLALHGNEAKTDMSRGVGSSLKTRHSGESQETASRVS